MLGHLIYIGSSTTAGLPLPLRLASVDTPEVCHLDGKAWAPNIARLPALRYDFFGGAFNGNITAPQMQFTVSVDGIDDFTDMVFAASPVQFWRGEVGDDWPYYTMLFSGVIATEPEIRAGLATFTANVDDTWLDQPLLATYAGTDGIEGTEDKAGLAKPLVLGNVRFADAVLLDPVDLVYQVSDGAVSDITAAYDRVASLGASSGDYADFTALTAATIPNGGWATSLDYGLVRFGAPPDGRVAFDVHGAGGYVLLPGEIIGYIVELAGGTADAANLAALDVDCPWQQGLQLNEQTTARDVIMSMADSICAVAGVTWLGTLFVQALAIDDDPTETLATDGSSEIAVDDVSALPIAAPYWRLATQAERTWAVYGLGEVASGYAFRGAYEAAREYRLDDVVFATDGRSFAYINATPDSGNAPPAMPTTSNSYWGEVGAATVGAPTGTTVAGRDADDVASTVAAGGGVDTDQVSTDSVQAEAITTKAYAFTAGSVNISSGSYTWQEVQSATITTTGEDVEVEGAAAIDVIDNCKYKYRLLRDASAIITIGPITVNTSDQPFAFVKYVDSPTAGTYEYTLEIACNDAGDIDALNRGLSAKEIKR